MTYHLPADFQERWTALCLLQVDPKVINEDGTSVDPTLEIASEVFRKPRNRVTFEERNAALAAINEQLWGMKKQPDNPFTASQEYARNQTQDHSADAFSYQYYKQARPSTADEIIAKMQQTRPGTTAAEMLLKQEEAARAMKNANAGFREELIRQMKAQYGL